MRWISSKELKIYLIVVGAVTLAALFITLIALLPGYIKYNNSIEESNQVIEESIDVSKFRIPESYKQIGINNWAHFLPDKENWTKSDIEPYWQNTEELILNYLEEQNEMHIDDIFEAIP